jgi:hypothetical protein
MAKLLIIVTGIDFINSHIIPLNQKYNGTKITIVAEVPKIIALE